MQRESYQVVLASIWVLAIGLSALAAGVASVPALVVVGIVALAPPVVMQLLWRDPPQTMTESIRQAKR
jgi:predicted phage tail protein